METRSSEAHSKEPQKLTRRTFVRTAAGALGALGVSAAGTSRAQEFSAGETVRYPDSRIFALDKRFAKYKIGNTLIQRLYHNPSMLWAEGCAWNAIGKYL